LVICVISSRGVRGTVGGAMPNVGLRRTAPTEETPMDSAVVKRSIVISGHKTSVSLEDDFWNGLKQIGRENKTTLSGLVADIDVSRLHNNLSSAIRIFVLHHFRAQIPQTSTNGIEAGTETPRNRHAGPPSFWMNGQTG
jgi:predicted DNA-binding ribbon-helix-helix protein